MPNKNNLFTISILLFILISLSACSHSSYHERYETNRLPVKTKKNIAEYVPFVKVTNAELEMVINNLKFKVEKSKKKKIFLNEIIYYLKTPYLYGGDSKKGIDCSAFTQNVYRSLGVYIPRTAKSQYNRWQIFEDRDDLKFGDLIYFDTIDDSYPGHVGIFLDDEYFAHASSSSGVIISKLSNSYYHSKFIGANRVTIKK